MERFFQKGCSDENDCILQDETLVLAHRLCSAIFMISPQYNLGMALYHLNSLFYLKEKAAEYLGAFFMVATFYET